MQVVHLSLDMHKAAGSDRRQTELLRILLTLNGAVEWSPADAAALLRRANHFFDAGRLQAALVDHVRAAELVPALAEAPMGQAGSGSGWVGSKMPSMRQLG